MAIKQVVLWLSAISYGILIWYLAPIWSFDYDALIASSTYYRQNGADSFMALLGNNVVLLFIWDFFFASLSPSASVALLYGFAAAVRVLVFFSLFRFRLCLPMFIATAVFNDLNLCRYSLALSLGLLTLSRLGAIRAGILTFPLHIFTPAAIFMLSTWNKSWRILIVCFLLLLTFILPVLFGRHFSVLDDPFPRITYVYIGFTSILLFSFRSEIATHGFNFGALMLGLALFSLANIPFAGAYYFRFANLAYEACLLLIAFHYSGLRNLSSLPISSLKYGQYITGCLLGITYSFILIGGNIWRFF